MKGDFARVTFDPRRHYSQVFRQQGRVSLEADWNEQGAIQLHLLRTLAMDLVGTCWAAGEGFSITVPADQPSLASWQLSPGHFYVDGILCESEAACSLAAQPYAPTPEGDFSNVPGVGNQGDGVALYLDVWERHLSWVEAPGLNDIALGGVDTATRAQVVWQLRWIDQPAAAARLDNVLAALNRRKASGDATAQSAIDEVTQLRAALSDEGGSDGDQPQSDMCALGQRILQAPATYARPRLRASLQPGQVDADPCVIAADAGYRGVENQLYRVEIHAAGLGAVTDPATGNMGAAATFKWSRENGSVIFPITRVASGTESGTLQITLASLGRDARLGLVVGDWIELLDDDITLAQRAWPLLQVAAIDAQAGSVSLSVPKSGAKPSLPDPDRHALLRRWDQRAPDRTGNLQNRDAWSPEGVLPLTEGAWIDLEDGVQIRFEPGGLYANGDYWTIPARVAGNGVLDWPLETGADSKPVAAAVAAGGMHHQAMLGLTNSDGFHECCCRFPSLCALMRDGQPGATKKIAQPVLVVSTAKAKAKARPKLKPKPE